MEENFGLRDLKEIREKLLLPRKESLRRPRRVRQRCSLFPEPEYTGANHLDDWLKQLASCDKPLAKLATEVPYISSTGYSRGREVLSKLTELQVPLIRATWFVKVTVSVQLWFVLRDLFLGVGMYVRLSHSPYVPLLSFSYSSPTLLP